MKPIRAFILATALVALTACGDEPSGELSEAEQQKLNEVAEMLDDNVFDASPDSLVANEAELEPIEPVAPADAGSDNSAVNAAEDGVQ